MILKSSQVGTPGADAILIWLQCFLTSKPLLVQSTQFHAIGLEEMAAPRVNPHERVVCDPGEQPTSRSTCFRAATCARALELAISWLVQFWSLRNGLSGGTDCDHPLPCSQGPGLCYHCAVVWNTEPAPGPKSMSRIPTIRPCLLEAGLLHVSF